MSKKIISFIFLLTLFFYQFSHAEIVTLDDGRVVKLHEDGTFTVLSESNTDTNTNNNSSFEDSIINIFNLLGIQYETVNYVNNSNLIIKNITIENINIEELIIEKPNEKYFNNININSFNKYEGKFFDKLIIKKLSPTNNEEFYIGYLELIKFDLKEIKLLKDMITGESTDYVFGIANIIDSVSLKTLTMNDVSFEFETDFYAYDSITVNNLKNSSLAELIYKGAKIQRYDEYAELETMEIRNLKFNSPSTYISEFNYMEHPRELFLFFDSLDSFKFENFYQEVYDRNGLSYVATVDTAEISNFKTKQINGLSIPISFDNIVSGITITTDDQSFKDDLDRLGYSELKFDYSINFKWRPSSEIFTFNFNIGMQEGAEILFKTKFDDIDLYTLINDSTTPIILDYLQTTPKISSIDLTLKDKGLTPRMLEYGAYEMGMSSDQLVTFITSQLQAYSVYVESPLTNQFIISLQNFLENPNSLSFKIQPKASLTYDDILSLSYNPSLLVEVLNIKIR